MSIYGSYTEQGYIIRASDGASIPPDPANRDYRDAMAALAAGDTITAWVADPAEAWTALRAERDRLLTASDYTQLPDAPVDAAAWAAYRQALRDLPEVTADPAAPVWPDAPA